MSPLVLGLDLGTTNAKAAAYDLHGNVVGERMVTYPTSYPHPGAAEQTIADWVAALSAACRQLMALLGKDKDALMAIGLSSHGPGVILLDDTGKPLLPTSPIWQDRRSSPQGDDLLEMLGEGWTGLGIARNSFPAQLKWTIEHFPKQATQATYALGIKEYLTFWLTGEIVTEPSQVAGGEQWSPKLIEASGWDVSRLAPVQSASAFVCKVRSTLVSELGLPAALPVITGLADGAAATLSMGAIQVNSAVLTLATSGVIRFVLPKPVDPLLQRSHDLFCWPYLDGLWIVGGHIKAAASALHWLSSWQTSTPDEHSLAKLIASAQESPAGSRGVVFLPYLLGRGSPHADEAAQAAFLGLSLAHQPSDLTRSVLEGVAFAYRDLLDDFLQLGYAVPELRISGGGARSAFWRQILADVLNRPLIYYNADSTLGVALLATLAVGIHTDLSTAIQAMVRPQERVETIAHQVAQYEPHFQRYQAFRDRLYPVSQPRS